MEDTISATANQAAACREALQQIREDPLIRRETAYHEAGHAVVMIYAGGRVELVEFLDDAPESLGQCRGSGASKPESAYVYLKFSHHLGV